LQFRGPDGDAKSGMMQMTPPLPAPEQNREKTSEATKIPEPAGEKPTAPQAGEVVSLDSFRKK
jgi:hypothetical protein